ncbi:AAA family ATPase [Aureimonas mangrovi]|uniref:AAA family ATPase n=1 Tax=Aureimonas mangrovi TaxID=2758041 RepID=UPI00163D5E84|nr:ATP-binding protein [Aureimonas mangrovi]
MYLRSLKVRDFAGLDAADLEFDEGLNVVVGDNEAGKSTLLAALRAAFFVRHRASGENVKALAPYGRTARPDVSVAFALDGVDYRLTKGFLQRAEAVLEWPGGRLEGDAVEERLVELLGFAHGARGSKIDENQGAFGLLWVEQGNAPAGLDLGVGRHAVTASLEGEVGQILGGERGRRLLVAAKALQDRFFTGTLRVKADSPLKLAEDALEALRSERSERVAALAEYEERIEKLSDRRARLASYERDDVRGRAETALAKAEEAARALDGARRDLDEAERGVKRAEAAFDAAAARASARRNRRSQAADAAVRTEALAGRLAELAEDAAARATARESAQAALDEARARLAAAETAAGAGRRAAERVRLAEDAQRLRRDLATARELAERLRALAEGAPASSIDERAVKALEAAERERREAEIRLSVAAPVVVFAPRDGRTIKRADGEAVAAGAEIRVGEAAEFALEGFGSLSVRPGGSAGELAATLRSARAREAELLHAGGVVSAAEARAMLAKGEERAREAASLRADLARAAPNGIDALAHSLDDVSRKLAAFGEEEVAAGDRDALEQALRAARERLARAEAVREAAGSAAGAADLALARAESDVAHARETAEGLAAALRVEEGERTDAALDEDVAAADVERQGERGLLSARRHAFEKADPDAVRLERDRAAKVVTETARTLTELMREASALEGELRVQGAASLGEHVERLDGEIASAEAEVARLRLEADASRLLHETLSAAQSDAREHWLGPIKSRVAPYLRLIQPESEIAFHDESLEIRSLQRHGREEEFRRLSHGAREQIAVVTRIALAEVLKNGGHPAAVILDDALVNTDEKRLARMHLVLRRAAERLQVIVLTCRERDFRDLGAPIRRL